MASSILWRVTGIGRHEQIRIDNCRQRPLCISIPISLWLHDLCPWADGHRRAPAQTQRQIVMRQREKLAGEDVSEEADDSRQKWLHGGSF